MKILSIILLMVLPFILLANNELDFCEDEKNNSKELNCYIKSAVFTKIDKDKNGVSEQLEVKIIFEFKEIGNYFINGKLYKENTLISNQEIYNSAKNTSYIKNVSEKVENEIILYFSGEQILNSKIDGIYNLKVILINSNGYFETIYAFSDEINHKDFGEKNLYIENIEELIDINNDIINIKTTLNVISKGDYFIKATLLKDENTIQNIVKPIKLNKGKENISISFSSLLIKKYKKDGIFEIVVNISNSNNETIESKIIKTEYIKLI